MRWRLPSRRGMPLDLRRRPCAVCTVGVMPSDECKVRYPALHRRGTSSPMRRDSRKVMRPADFFFVIRMIDQCSRYQHRSPVIENNRKEPANAHLLTATEHDADEPGTPAPFPPLHKGRTLC